MQAEAEALAKAEALAQKHGAALDAKGWDRHECESAPDQHLALEVCCVLSK